MIGRTGYGRDSQGFKDVTVIKYLPQSDRLCTCVGSSKWKDQHVYMCCIGHHSFCNSKLCMTDNLGRIARVAEIILLLFAEGDKCSNTRRERSLKVHVGV